MTRIPVETEQQESESKPSNEEVFLDFVNQQIEALKRYTQFGADTQITFDELNNALCGYQKINLGLISLYNIAKIELALEKERFEDWYAEKFIEVRARVNQPSMAAQKWASQKEIEMIVRKDFGFEHAGRKESLIILERKVAFLRRLLDSWNSQQYILSTLSKNLQSEIGSSHMPSDAVPY